MSAVFKPFLFLAARAEAVAADAEYAAVCRYTGLEPAELVRVRLDQGPLPELDLADYSGVIIGGSPFNVSDDQATKSAVQQRVEAELHGLLDQAIAQDFPVLGLCYGMGLLTQHLGGMVDLTYGEGAGTVAVEPTPAGFADPLLAGAPARFLALTGHNEAARALPPGATLLASAVSAPVQMIRVGRNVYAVQFHPELDVPGLTERLRIYLHKGYCQPDEYDQVVASIQGANLTPAHQILKNFATHHRRKL